VTEHNGQAQGDGGRPIRVAIVDDEVMVRQYIGAQLAAIDGIEVVAEAGSGTAAVEVARRHAPDVMLMDIRMPGGNGVDATAEIARVAPGVRVIAMTALAADEYVHRMLAAGAVSYLVKTRVVDEVEPAIRSAVLGESTVLPLASVQALARRLGDGEDARRQAERLLETLSPREREVALLLARGDKLPAIAAQLGIGAKTARDYEVGALRKLGAANRTVAAQIVAVAGLGPELFPVG